MVNMAIIHTPRGVKLHRSEDHSDVAAAKEMGYRVEIVDYTKRLQELVIMLKRSGIAVSFVDDRVEINGTTEVETLLQELRRG